MSLITLINNFGYLIKKPNAGQEYNKLNSKLKADLIVKPIVIKAFSHYNKSDIRYTIYKESPNYFIIPRFYGIKNFGLPEQSKILLDPEKCTKIDIIFKYDLKPTQFNGYNKTLNCLKTIGGGILSLPCGYGKTAIAIKISTELKVKTLIVVNKECLMDQWIDSIKKFTNSERIGIIQQSKFEVENKDYVIAIIHTLALKDFKPDQFKSFGLCIIDECHHLGSDMFSNIFFKACCPYMLGLSATPTRKDGLAKVFHYFLGDLSHSEKRTGSDVVVVKKINLRAIEYVPEYELLVLPSGTKNTVAMLTNITKYNKRNILIIECIKAIFNNNEDRKLLLLSSRREHLETIYDMLSNIKNSVTGENITYGYYYGNKGGNKKNHKNMLIASAKCDVVLGTFHIASEGLDIPDLNTLLFGSPSQDIEQSVGRILRKKHNISPIIIDIIDDCGNFKKHGNVRDKLYRSEKYFITSINLNIDQCEVEEIIPFFTEENEEDIESDDHEDNSIEINKCLIIN